MAEYKKLNTNDFKEFEDKNKKYKEGIFELQLNSWDEFCDVEKKFNDYPDYIWRGQKEDWQLKSSFDRNSFTKKFSYLFGRQKVVDKLLEKFKKKLLDLPRATISNDDDGIWAIGQHYGLPTPLLDWTTNPYIAAYFAFYERKTNEKYRIVYALSKSVKQLKAIKKDLKKQKLSSEPFLEFLDLIETPDKIQNIRLEKQEGRFTKSLNGIDIESNVKKYAKKRPAIVSNKEILLMKTFIPDILREEFLKYQKFKDITYGKLFPDYAGAVDICKIDLGIV